MKMCQKNGKQADLIVVTVFRKTTLCIILFSSAYFVKQHNFSHALFFACHNWLRAWNKVLHVTSQLQGWMSDISATFEREFCQRKSCLKSNMLSGIGIMYFLMETIYLFQRLYIMINLPFVHPNWTALPLFLPDTRHPCICFSLHSLAICK